MMQTLKTLPVSLDDLLRARDRIVPFVLETPLVESESLSRELGCCIRFKCENLQHVGAFKARGACNAVLSLKEEEARRGVVTHSSGNHAAALARAAAIRAIPVHIVMPNNTAAGKIATVRAFGVSPILCEPDAVSRQRAAEQTAEQTGATMVPPYNDPKIIAGQGTVGLELLEQWGEFDTVVVPVGGGGLLSGVLVAIKSSRPDVRVVASEPAWADDAARSLRSGTIEMPQRYDTIADGLRTPLGDLTFPIIQGLLDEILLVDEATIANATRIITARARLVAEPSGAVAMAALLQHPSRFRGRKVVVIVSGGNLDFEGFQLTDTR
jgi:threonine dehydratase